jgi:hypothetical protein
MTWNKKWSQDFLSTTINDKIRKKIILNNNNDDEQEEETKNDAIIFIVMKYTI